VINQEEIALGFNKLSYIRTLPKIEELRLENTPLGSKLYMKKIIFLKKIIRRCIFLTIGFEGGCWKTEETR